jgi:hypothetical protein
MEQAELWLRRGGAGHRFGLYASGGGESSNISGFDGCAMKSSGDVFWQAQMIAGMRSPQHRVANSRTNASEMDSAESLALTDFVHAIDSN